MANSGFDQIANDLLRGDAFNYSFNLKDGDPVRASADLDEAIAILVARPEIEAAIADVNNDEATLSAEAFDRQVALVKERQALDARLANLVQANEDARAFSTEGN